MTKQKSVRNLITPVFEIICEMPGSQPIRYRVGEAGVQHIELTAEEAIVTVRPPMENEELRLRHPRKAVGRITEKKAILDAV